MTQVTRTLPRSRGPRASLLLLVVAFSLAAASAAAASGPAIVRYTFAGGGGPVTAGDYTLHGHAGEAFAGGVSAEGLSVGGGFWAPPLPTAQPTPDTPHGAYLPLTVHGRS